VPIQLHLAAKKNCVTHLEVVLLGYQDRCMIPLLQWPVVLYCCYTVSLYCVAYFKVLSIGNEQKTSVFCCGSCPCLFCILLYPRSKVKCRTHHAIQTSS